LLAIFAISSGIPLQAAEKMVSLCDAIIRKATNRVKLDFLTVGRLAE
jgi:hypothetical protein